MVVAKIKITMKIAEKRFPVFENMQMAAVFDDGLKLLRKSTERRGKVWYNNGTPSSDPQQDC